MGSIRRHIGGDVVKDRKGEASVVRGNEEKCDRCSSFLTGRIDHLQHPNRRWRRDRSRIVQQLVIVSLLTSTAFVD